MPVSVMPLVISLISMLSVLPSLLVKALSRSLSAPNPCNCPLKITFLLQPSPLTSSYSLSSSYLHCSYSSSLVLPLNFLWNTLLKFSLLFKWANLTSNPAVSRRWVSVTKKDLFPYQWQRRKCFSLCDIKIPNWWHEPCRVPSPWRGSFEDELGWHISYLWGSSKGTSSIIEKNQTWESRRGRELQVLALRTGLQMSCSFSSLSQGWTKPWMTWSDLRIDLALSRTPDSPSSLNFPRTPWSHILFYTIFLKIMISRVSTSPAQRKTVLQR